MNVEAVANLIRTFGAHWLFFEAITALIAAMTGAITLRLGRQALPEERWIRYFGWGFVIFAYQYAASTAQGLIDLFKLPLPTLTLDAVEGFQRLASGCNNVVFLAAGLALWRPGWRPSRKYWALASAVALVSVLMNWMQWFAPWHRSLDGIFSAVTLGFLGIAFYVNASPRRRWGLLALATLGAFLYALINLAFASAPAFVTGRLWSDWAEQISFSLGTPTKGIHPKLGLYIDSLLIALTLPFKILLSFAGFALVMRAMVPISPRELSNVLEGVGRSELDYFSGNGIVRSIGESFSADSARICYRRPGLKEGTITQWAWPESNGLSLGAPLPPANDGREGQVLASGQTISTPAWGHVPSGQWSWSRHPEAHSLIATPIFFQGTVIGCLTVEWRIPYSFTNTAILLAERSAAMLGPVIESRRKLEALVFWSRRLQESGVETNPPGYLNLAKILASLVHETLSPIAVSLWLKVGFAPVWAVAGNGGARAGSPDDLPFGGLEQLLRELGEEESTRLEEADIKFGTTSIGTLAILWPEIKPPLIRPLIRSDALHLQSIAHLIANTVLRNADADFSRMLSVLQADLAAAQSLEEWSDAVVRTVLSAGPIWALIVNDQSGFYGNGLPDLVKEYSSQAEEERFIWSQRLDQPRAGTRHLVRIFLPRSNAQLWLGISNPELKPELESFWPWRSFLERLAEAADASLSGLIKSAELHRVKKETGEIQGLLRSTVDSGAFIHEMRNIARNFSLAAQSLDGARRRGELTASIDIEADILDMRRSAERLHGLADAVLKPSAMDGRLVYPLSELVHEVHNLYAPILKQRRIDFLEEVPRTLEVATPSYAVHLALVSLISNSIDAIKEDGRIRVVARPPLDGFVDCDVIDSGPGIQLPDPQVVFDLGQSTKGSGGMGLFMVRQLLEAVGAKIQLTNPTPGQTTFTIHLRLAFRRD